MPISSRMSEPVFRVLLSLIFVTAGLQHMLRTEHVAARLESAPFASLALQLASAEFLVAAAGVGLLVGGLALMTGAMTRLTALALIGLLIPITVTVQLGSVEALGPLMKNMAILGGLIHFAVNGSRVCSLDGRLARNCATPTTDAKVTA